MGERTREFYITCGLGKWRVLAGLAGGAVVLNLVSLALELVGGERLWPVTVLAVLAYVALLVLALRTLRLSRTVPIVRVTEDELQIRSLSGPRFRVTPWREVKGIAWSGDELGIRVEDAAFADDHGSVVGVPLVGLDEDAQSELIRLIEQRSAA